MSELGNEAREGQSLPVGLCSKLRRHVGGDSQIVVASHSGSGDPDEVVVEVDDDDAHDTEQPKKPWWKLW